MCEFAGPRSLRQLLDAVLTVGSDLDLPAMLQRIVEAAVELVDARHAAADVRIGDLVHRVTIDVDERGALRSVWLSRWGNPDGGAFAEHPFGVEFGDSAGFDGYRIPTALRAGWASGSDTSHEEVFFRATIVAARYGDAADASVGAFHLAMAISAGLVLFGGVLGLLGIRNPRREVKSAECPGGQLVGSSAEAARGREEARAAA